MNSIKYTARWLTTHYEVLVKDAEDKDPDIVEYYSAEHWDKATLKELCEELHQIIYDEERDGIIALAGYFTELGTHEGHEEVLKMFGKTTEHSH